MKNPLIGPIEAATFIIAMMGTKVFLGYPRLAAEVGFTAGWLIALLSGLISIVFWLLISHVLLRFPGKSLAEIIENVFGAGLGLIINFILIGYLFLITSNMVRLFSETVIITVLTETPLSVLVLLYILGSWIAAYYGLTAIAHSAYISFSFVAIGIGIVLLSLYPYYDLRQLLPLMGSGGLAVLKESFLITPAFGEVIFLAYLTKYFSFGAKEVKKIGVYSIAYITGIFVVVNAVYLMVFPYPASLETLVPFYQISRSIFLGHFFQRMEAVFTIVWTFIAFIRISAGLTVVAVVLRDILKVPYYRPLLPALCLLAFSIALTPLDFMQAVQKEGTIKTYGWLITFLLPLFVAAVVFITRKGEKRINDAES